MPIQDPVSATYIFTALLVGALALSVRPRKTAGFTTDVVQELKGFAILAIVLSHVGYFLVADHRFLFPLSTIAGVGVDLFLFVSGFGLAASAFKNLRPPLDFYLRRIDKLFLPLWGALAAFFVLDFYILGKSYPLGSIFSSFLGWFPSADIYNDLNSPLWYITLILFFYLIFPLLFSPKRPVFSAAAIAAAAYVAFYLAHPLISGVAHLYELHLWAFPLGVAFASMARNKAIGDINNPLIHYPLCIFLMLAIGYLALHANIGAGVLIEQGTSVLTALLVAALFLVKRFEVRLLYLFGIFSYEIYLFHWPIMYRYDFLFGVLPPWLAMFTYLAFFLALGWLTQTALKRLPTVR